MKQSKYLNGGLEPEHQKTTDMSTMSSTTDIDSQTPTIPIFRFFFSVYKSYFSLSI